MINAGNFFLLAIEIYWNIFKDKKIIKFINNFLYKLSHNNLNKLFLNNKFIVFTKKYYL